MDNRKMTKVEKERILLCFSETKQLTGKIKDESSLSRHRSAYVLFWSKPFAKVEMVFFKEIKGLMICK